MEISSKTDRGIVRPNNEDSLLVVAPWNRLAISGKACIFVVCDGMGGHRAGEVASGIAVKAAKEYFSKNISGDISVEFMEKLVTFANEQVWEYAQSHLEHHKGMGTTFSALLIKGKKAVIGHIGDSRIYRLREGELKQLTKDHSIVGEMVRRGKLTLNQARVHPMRGTLSKVLGARQFILPDIFETDIQVNDKFVLCTDGVYSMIDSENLESLIKDTPSEKIAKVLVDAANAAGGKDNCTAIGLKLDELPTVFPSMLSFSRFLKLLYNSCSNVW